MELETHLHLVFVQESNFTKSTSWRRFLCHKQTFLAFHVKNPQRPLAAMAFLASKPEPSDFGMKRNEKWFLIEGLRKENVDKDFEEGSLKVFREKNILVNLCQMIFQEGLQTAYLAVDWLLLALLPIWPPTNGPRPYFFVALISLAEHGGCLPLDLLVGFEL